MDCILQIVPQLPPAINGLGDYALNLAQQLCRDFDVGTHFLVGDPDWSGATHIEGFPISQITERSIANVVSMLKRHPSTVLCHYVGYGYAQRGCPVWLIQGLKEWKTDTANSRLVTMFHELYASGPPWTSAFWLSKQQKNLAAGLARISDRCFTNQQTVAKAIDKLSPSKHPHITTVPVFSNVGEPAQPLPLVERSRRLVVFGHRNSRLQVYQKCGTALEQICQALQIEEIYDIGVPIGLDLPAIGGVRIVEKGVIEAIEVSQILQDSVAGFLNFPPPAYLAKSSIFAAYCAHKVIPCMDSYSTEPIDGLQTGKHYWACNNQNGSLSIEIGQKIADNTYTWYHAHDLSVQAKLFAAALVGIAEKQRNERSSL